MRPNPAPVLLVGAHQPLAERVVPELLRAGFPVRAVTHHTHSDAARLLRHLGAETMQPEVHRAGELLPLHVRRLLPGVQAMLMVHGPLQPFTLDDVREQTVYLHAALEARLDHVVYVSAAAADQRTCVPSLEARFLVEERLRSLGLGYTILAPAFLMERLLAPPILQGLAKGLLTLPMCADAGFPVVSMANVGAVAAEVLRHPDRYLGTRIELASDETTCGLAAAALSSVLGRPITYSPVRHALLAEERVQDAALFDWIERSGSTVDIQSLRASWQSVPWHTFPAWASRQTWVIPERETLLPAGA